MLVEGFYKVAHKDVSDNEINASILLNPDHPIYKGHFPDQPVMPGVMQIQIIREVVEEEMGCKLLIEKIRQIKFFIPIVPVENDLIKISISYINNDELNVKFFLSYMDRVCAKGMIYFSKV